MANVSTIATYTRFWRFRAPPSARSWHSPAFSVHHFNLLGEADIGQKADMRQHPQGLYRDVRMPLAGSGLCETGLERAFFNRVTIYNCIYRLEHAEAENNQPDG